MTNFSRFVGASALALALSSHAAHAEDAPEQATITVTATRISDDPAKEAERRPGGVDVVSAEAFEDRVAVSLRDALAFSPGVYTQPRFGQEVRIAVRGSGISRGFHMRGLTLLLDGVPINLADDNGDFQELDPQVFERLEVYRGANALRLGGSTLGGAVNAVTPTGRSAPGLAVRIDGGSYDTLRGKVAAGFHDARGDAFVAVTGDRSDGDRQHAWRKAVRFTGNAGLRLGEGAETRVYATVSNIAQRLPGALTFGQALATPDLSLPANITGDQQRNLDSIRLQSRTTVDVGGVRLAFGGFFNTRDLYHPIFQVIDQKGVDRGAFASIDLGGTIGAMTWDATLGTQARFGSVAARQFVNVGGRRGALTADVAQRAHTINSYGEFRLTPVTGLTLIAGGIHTAGERRIANRLVPARSGEARFDAFSPKFGVLADPARGIQAYANYSRSVELPGYSELSQVPAGGLPGFTPISPQKAWTAEIGTRGTRGIAAWDISLYRADIVGELLQYAVAPDIPASTFNAGRTRHQGIEAGLDLSFAPWLTLRQVYQLSDFRFRGDRQYRDNRLPVVPVHHYRAELALGGERLSVSPNIEWVPQGGWADYANSVRTPGYVLFGLGAQARVREGVSLFLDARNITARKAIGDISAVLLAAPGTASYYPVERRGVYGGVRARF